MQNVFAFFIVQNKHHILIVVCVVYNTAIIIILIIIVFLINSSILGRNLQKRTGERGAPGALLSDLRNWFIQHQSNWGSSRSSISQLKRRVSAEESECRVPVVWQGRELLPSTSHTPLHHHYLLSPLKQVYSSRTHTHERVVPCFIIILLIFCFRAQMEMKEWWLKRWALF